MRGLPALAAAVACAIAAPALAIRTELGGDPFLLDLSETADVAFHVDNGTIAAPGTPNYDPTSNDYFDWLNRFDAQASWRRWHAELRFDSAVFANAPSVGGPFPNPSQCFGANAFVSYCENLHLANLLENRYIDNFGLEKVSLNYLDDHFDVTLGDFYLSYGRGIVVSILKIDALGVDTTVRGLNASYHLGGFSANVAAGLTNVVNTDEATGEVAPDPDDGIAAARLEYRVPRWFTLGVDGAGFFQNPQTTLLGNYTPGTATQSVGLGLFTLGSIQSQPIPPGSVAPTVSDTGNFSATLDLPWLGRWGKLYLEEARQVQTTYTNGCGLYPGCGTSGNHETTNGNAFFASADAFLGPATLLVEFKDYQSFFFPVPNSLPSVMFPAFWQQNVYSNPPNLEEIFQEEQLTSHIFGPRARLDYKIDDHVAPYVSFAYFEDDTNQYDIYDGYVGADVNWQQHRSHANVAVGRRYEIENQLAYQPGSAFQQEWWVQYDAVQVLGDVYSLELEGLHRRFDYDQLTGHAWSWGYAYLSLKRSAWTATLGYEYNTQYPDLWRPENPNAGISWIISDHYTVRVFGGGREAGLRCINGICRNFPGFTGGSAELVARY
ncbi:MAG TPA: hypothetical protein VMB50_02770 [Myxococcales bacterium]|nr:hypothetical protein [Myxococcales bacterium]